MKTWQIVVLIAVLGGVIYFAASAKGTVPKPAPNQSNAGFGLGGLINSALQFGTALLNSKPQAGPATKPGQGTYNTGDELAVPEFAKGTTLSDPNTGNVLILA